MADQDLTPQQLKGAMRRLVKNITKATVRGARKGLVPARGLLRQVTPGIGPLKNGWAVKRGTGDEIGAIENPVWYAGLVERGSKPMPVPMGLRVDIRMWVESHIGRISKAAGKPVRGEKRRAAVDKMVGDIVRQIQTKGYRPQFYVRSNLDRVTEELTTRIDRELGSVDDGVK